MEREVWVLFWDNPGLSWPLPRMMGILYINEVWDPCGRGMGLSHTPFFMSSRPYIPLMRKIEGRLGSFPSSTDLRWGVGNESIPPQDSGFADSAVTLEDWEKCSFRSGW